MTENFRKLAHAEGFLDAKKPLYDNLSEMYCVWLNGATYILNTDAIATYARIYALRGQNNTITEKDKLKAMPDILAYSKGRSISLMCVMDGDNATIVDIMHGKDIIFSMLK